MVLLELILATAEQNPYNLAGSVDFDDFVVASRANHKRCDPADFVGLDVI